MCLVAHNLCATVARDHSEAEMPISRRNVDGLTKFQRYRQQQQQRGMKELRLWVPDPRRPEFAAEARRQGLGLRGRAEEAEALAFIEAATMWSVP